MEFLRNLYRNFLVFDENYFLGDVKGWLGVKELKLTKEILEQFHENYQKNSFALFLKYIKDIVYSKNVFDFIPKNSLGDWDLWYYLKFLEKEKIIKIKRNGKVFVLKKEVLNLIPRPLSEEEIRDEIEKKLKTRVRKMNLQAGYLKDFLILKLRQNLTNFRFLRVRLSLP